MRKWAARQVVRFKWHLIITSLVLGVGYVVAILFLLPAITADQLAVFLGVQGVLLLLVQCADMVESDEEHADDESVG